MQLAHQWAGNLVTCGDWAHLTVNEGLASHLEYGCVEAILPGAQATALRRRAGSPMGRKNSLQSAVVQPGQQVRLAASDWTGPLQVRASVSMRVRAAWPC